MPFTWHSINASIRGIKYATIADKICHYNIRSLTHHLYLTTTAWQKRVQMICRECGISSDTKFTAHIKADALDQWNSREGSMSVLDEAVRAVLQLPS